MNKTKLPKFIATHNPMIGNQTIYIVHTQSPAFIAEAEPSTVVDFVSKPHPKFVEFNGKRISMGAQTTVNDVFYVITVRLFFEDPFPHMDETAQGSGGLMSRMGDWFHAYMKNISK